jgi:GTP-binding protein
MDAHIAGIALEGGKGIILAVNKWDAVVKRDHYENDQVADDLAQRKFLAKLQSEFAYLPWAPAIFISGKEGLNDKKLIDIIIKIFDQRKHRLSEEDLDLIKKTAEQNHPNLPMIYKIYQSNINPPTFDIIINRPQTWHFSFSRFIENLIRQVNAYNGTSIKINTVPYHKSQR